MKQTWFLVSLVTTIFASVPSAVADDGGQMEWGEQEWGMRMNIRVRSETVAPATPVFVNIAISNAVSKRVQLPIALPDVVNDITLVYASGEAVPRTLYGKKLLGKQPSVMKPCYIGPGDTFHETIALSRLFDMTLEGTYVLTIGRLAAIQPISPIAKRVTSNTIRLHVRGRPKNPAQ